MIRRTVSIDFSKKTGKAKPINCLNNGPKFGIELEYDFTEQYKEMAPPFIRISSPEAPYSSSRYLDLHCIFPDMALDERFEASFNFAPTDRYLASVKEAGADIFLRLGESPEPYEVKRYTSFCDAEKVARVFERIIAHYNKGWGNGFKYNIKYVEIMCDADTAAAWSRTPEEYYSFYSTVAKYLKEKYPKIKVGAYSSGGFYSLNHYGASEGIRRYIKFLEGFIDYVSRDNPSPLDFLSWKCYAESPEEIALHSNYAKSYLVQSGLKKTQSIITEFNLIGTDKGEYLERHYPAALARAFIIAQKSNVDMMFYSHLSPDSPWNAFYSLENRTDKRLYASYHVMRAFGSLVSLGNVVETTEDFRREIYSLATVTSDKGAFVLSTSEYSGIVEIKLGGAAFTKYSIMGVIGGGENGAGYFTEQRELHLVNNTVTLRVGKNEVYFIMFS